MLGPTSCTKCEYTGARYRRGALVDLTGYCAGLVQDHALAALHDSGGQCVGMIDGALGALDLAVHVGQFSIEPSDRPGNLSLVPG